MVFDLVCDIANTECLLDSLYIEMETSSYGEGLVCYQNRKLLLACTALVEAARLPFLNVDRS